MLLYEFSFVYLSNILIFSNNTILRLMIKRNSIVILLIFYSLVAFCQSSFQRKPEGILISVKQTSGFAAKTIRLQVITDDIIRVTATPLTKIQQTKSLITAYTNTKTTGWSAKKSGNFVVLTTATTKAFISIKTGEIRFTDLRGNIILQEQRGGGKSFKPIEVEGKSGFSFRQVFESPADEAFYGLGQHQSDEFNYKGKNEELFQYNTKVSIPFIVSNKNY